MVRTTDAQTAHLPVGQPGPDPLVDLRPLRLAALQHPHDVVAPVLGEVVAAQGIVEQLPRLLAPDLRLEEDPKEDLARLATASRKVAHAGYFPRVTRAGRGCSDWIRSAISRAERAASQPRPLCLIPARSIACSMVSAVMTPKTTGTRVSQPARARPAAVSLAT